MSALRISPHYTQKQWNEAFASGEDWKTAIDIVEDRIRGRWLDAADRLLDGSHSGFAILALDCIVLESLWGFMNGKSVPKRQEQQVYASILSGPRFKWPAAEAEAFRQFVRNGVIHDAETRSRWLVEKTVPRGAIVRQTSDGDYQLNRTNFHKALSAAFGDWIKALRAGDTALRINMRDRMNQIISKHYTS